MPIAPTRPANLLDPHQISMTLSAYNRPEISAFEIGHAFAGDVVLVDSQAKLNGLIARLIGRKK